MNNVYIYIYSKLCQRLCVISDREPTASSVISLFRDRARVTHTSTRGGSVELRRGCFARWKPIGPRRSLFYSSNFGPSRANRLATRSRYRLITRLVERVALVERGGEGIFPSRRNGALLLLSSKLFATFHENSPILFFFFFLHF